MTKRRQITFIHIPKTAGISFIKTYEDSGIKFWGHDIRKKWFRYFPDNIQTFYSKYLPFIAKEHFFAFAVVRNTWDRVFSAYNYLKNDKGNDDDKKEAEIYVKPYDNFTDFVINGLETASKEQLHFFPQTKWIYNSLGVSVMNDLIKYEDLENGIKKVMQKLKIPYKPLPFYNKSGNSDYKTHYTKETIDIVAKIYKDEIKKLNYKY